MITRTNCTSLHIAFKILIYTHYYVKNNPELKLNARKKIHEYHSRVTA